MRLVRKVVTRVRFWWRKVRIVVVIGPWVSLVEDDVGSVDSCRARDRRSRNL